MTDFLNDLIALAGSAKLASEGPAAVAIYEPGREIEHITENLSHGTGNVWTVYLPEHPDSDPPRHTPGEMRANTITVCITGNGPTSQKNAEFIADCFTYKAVIQQALDSIRDNLTR